jgi:hypothetical protein
VALGALHAVLSDPLRPRRRRGRGGGDRGAAPCGLTRQFRAPPGRGGRPAQPARRGRAPRGVGVDADSDDAGGGLEPGFGDPRAGDGEAGRAAALAGQDPGVRERSGSVVRKTSDGKLIRLDLGTKEATTLHEETKRRVQHVCLHEIDLASLLQGLKVF